MAIDAELLKEIKDLGLVGGFVFEWTDEWFKATWNTFKRQLPVDRRALWHDPWTNEQWFGVVAADPARAISGAAVGSRGCRSAIGRRRARPGVAVPHCAHRRRQGAGGAGLRRAARSR